MVTIHVAGDGHLKSMRSMLTLARVVVVTTTVSLVCEAVMGSPWQMVEPVSAAWMTKGDPRLGTECPNTLAITWEADVLEMPL